MSNIKAIKAREVLDSRGNSTYLLNFYMLRNYKFLAPTELLLLMVHKK